MLIITTLEYRPSYDELDLEPLTYGVYTEFPSNTIRRYVGEGTVTLLDAVLYVTAQGETKQLDDELALSRPMDYNRLLELLDSRDYTIEEVRIVAQYKNCHKVYTLKNV